MKKTLTIGDEVSWRGGWGSDKPKIVKVESIEIDCNGSKSGTDVLSCDWSKITDRNAIISLDNEHWCWGYQISQIK